MNRQSGKKRSEYTLYDSYKYFLEEHGRQIRCIWSKLFFKFEMLLFAILFSLGVFVGSFVSVIPKYNFTFPFDFVTISLTLAGFLIVGGVWKDDNKRLFKIGKDYLFSAISFMIFYFFAPYVIPYLNQTPQQTIVITGVIDGSIVFSFLFGWLLGAGYFVRATYDLVTFLRQEG